MPLNPTLVLTPDDVLSKDTLNTFVLIPLSDLITPPQAYYMRGSGDPTLTQTSTTFGALDDTLGHFYLGIQTKGNPVEIGARLVVSNSGAAAYTYFDVEVNGAMIGGANGIYAANSPAASTQITVAFRELLFNTSGNLDVKLRWRVSAGTATLNPSYVPSFWVREL